MLTELDLYSHHIYTVRGPRQVGKTTLLKLLIRERLDAGFDVHRVLYYSLDLERTPDEIVEVVRTAKSNGYLGGQNEAISRQEPGLLRRILESGPHVGPGTGDWYWEHPGLPLDRLRRRVGLP